MADVYSFRIKLKNCAKEIYRDIEVSSLTSVAKLGYTVIASFEGTASHLFCIHYKNSRYEIDWGLGGKDAKTIDPIKAKLSALGLSVGSTMMMEYDYGAGWQFSLELLSINEMKKGAGTHYPYVLEGQGKGIIEDVFPPQLNEIMIEMDETGIIPEIFDAEYGKMIAWDYRKFNLKYMNALLKGDIAWIQEAYEQNS